MDTCDRSARPPRIYREDAKGQKYEEFITASFTPGTKRWLGPNTGSDQTLARDACRACRGRLPSSGQKFWKAFWSETGSSCYAKRSRAGSKEQNGFAKNALRKGPGRAARVRPGMEELAGKILSFSKKQTLG